MADDWTRQLDRVARAGNAALWERARFAWESREENVPDWAARIAAHPLIRHSPWTVAHWATAWQARLDLGGIPALDASLVEDNGVQLATDGNHKHHIKKRASFFRRLAEAHGSPTIDFEIALCMVKPAAPAVGQPRAGGGDDVDKG